MIPRYIHQATHHKSSCGRDAHLRGPGGAGQGRAGQGRAGQGRAGQSRAGQNRAGQSRTPGRRDLLPCLSSSLSAAQLESPGSNSLHRRGTACRFTNTVSMASMCLLGKLDCDSSMSIAVTAGASGESRAATKTGMPPENLHWVVKQSPYMKTMSKAAQTEENNNV